MGSVEIVIAVVGTAITVVLAIIGALITRAARENGKRLGYLIGRMEEALKRIEEAILTIDRRTQQMHEDMQEGFERMHKEMQQLHKDMQEGFEKLGELTVADGERTRELVREMFSRK